MPDHNAPTSYQYHIPMDNEWSLLRIIEKRLQQYTPCLKQYYAVETKKKKKNDQHHDETKGFSSNNDTTTTIEIEFIRWSLLLFGSFIRKDSHHASIICNTTIITKLAGYCLHLSVLKNNKHMKIKSRTIDDEKTNSIRNVKNNLMKRNPNESIIYNVIDVTSWTTISMEDASFMLLLYGATYDDCLQSLCRIPDLQPTLQAIRTNCNQQQRCHETSCHNVRKKTSIHVVRAEALYERLFLETK
jgi:hypothetical protein